MARATRVLDLDHGAAMVLRQALVLTGMPTLSRAGACIRHNLSNIRSRSYSHINSSKGLRCHHISSNGTSMATCQSSLIAQDTGSLQVRSTPHSRILTLLARKI